MFLPNNAQLRTLEERELVTDPAEASRLPEPPTTATAVPEACGMAVAECTRLRQQLGEEEKKLTVTTVELRFECCIVIKLYRRCIVF